MIGESKDARAVVTLCRTFDVGSIQLACRDLRTGGWLDLDAAAVLADES